MATPVPDRAVGASAVPLPLSSPQELLHLREDLYRFIAQHAYELYEIRGSKQGQDISDWLQAEAEVVSPCRHQLLESPACVMFRVELPGTFTADQVKVSVEPRRVIVSARRDVMIDYCSANGHVNRPGPQRLFHIENLPAEIDPAGSHAILGCEYLDIVMPRVQFPHPGAATPPSRPGTSSKSIRPDSLIERAAAA